MPAPPNTLVWSAIVLPMLLSRPKVSIARDAAALTKGLLNYTEILYDMCAVSDQSPFFEVNEVLLLTYTHERAKTGKSKALRA